MLRLTLLLSLAMFAALMTLGSDHGQLRPGLALAASEGRLDEVWAEARAAAEPTLAAPAPMPVPMAVPMAEADTAIAAAPADPAPVAETAPPVVASADTGRAALPQDPQVQVLEEPVFTLANLGNERVPGEDGTPIEPAFTDDSETAPVVPQPEIAAAEAVPGGQGTIWYVNASSVNVRAAPTTDAEVLGKLGSGEAALMVASVGGEWAQIVIQGDGMEGYVALRYLTSEAP